MFSETQVFFSHRVEFLYQILRHRLFGEKKHPFAKRIILVPSQAMKTWIQLALADDPACGIAAGIDIYVDHTAGKLIRLFSDSSKRLPSRLELSLLIEKQLHLLLGDRGEKWQPLRDFIGHSSNKERSGKRTTQLAFELAKVFEMYGVYGGAALKQWNQHHDGSGWQEELWRRIWQSHPDLSYLTEISEEELNPNRINQEIEVHLFALSFLPPVSHRFLSRLSQSLPVNYYLLSPCHAFWSDVCSDRENRRLYAYWKKRGISEDQLTSLEDFLRDRNPLLANFGKMARDMAGLIETDSLHAEHLYALPSSLIALPAYREKVDADVIAVPQATSPTLLQCLQGDLTVLRNPFEGEKVKISDEDCSVQFHQSPTKRREVEVIYDLLMGIIDRHREEEQPIVPGRVIVMAPNLAEYEPYIKMVFGRSSSALDYQLMEVEWLGQSAYVQAFSQLLALASSKWDATSLLAFLEIPFVQRQQGFKKEDIKKFREWIKEAEICWGQNAEHRHQILERACGAGLVDPVQIGTWDSGFDRLLQGLALTTCQGQEFVSYAPLECVDASAAELLGKWIFFLRDLKHRLSPIHDGTQMTAVEWIGYLKDLLLRYFAVERSDYEELQAKEELEQTLNRWQEAAISADAGVCSYSSVAIYLENLLEAKKVSYRESHLQAVRFCSLLPMRALPADVVILFGLEEGAFPKNDGVDGWNVLRGHKNADPVPRQQELDRSVFIEALLSARRYFILSHSSFGKGQELAPSPLVTELMAYLNLGYTSSQFPISLRQHSLHGFDAVNFEEKGDFRSYTSSAYQAAKAHYMPEKRKKSAFIPDFDMQEPQLLAKQFMGHCISANLKDLTKMAKNPLQAYFNEALNVYIKEESHRYVETDERFVLDPLDLYIFKEKSLKKTAAQVIQEADKLQMLPSGIFKEIAKNKLSEQVATYQQGLDELGIEAETLVSIQLVEHCSHPIFEEKVWFFPPLVVPLEIGHSLMLTGKLPPVSTLGLLSLKTSKIEDVIEMWPSLLILAALEKKYALSVPVQICCLKDRKILQGHVVDLHACLPAFLDYYFKGVKTPSPLLPTWTKSIVEGDADNLKKIMQTNLHRAEDRFFNEYAKWCFAETHVFPNAEAIIHSWQEEAERVFRPLMLLCQSGSVK